MNFPELNVAGAHLSTWFVFGWLNIIAAKFLFIFLANRRGLPLSTAILLGLSYTIGAAVGTVVLYSITGTIAGIILFFFLGVYLLRIKEPLGDLLALVIAVALGIGRLGCLISGCCFGAPTTLPFGIQYASGTLPHWLHSSLYLIEPTAAMSLAVHPIQLYEILFLSIFITIQVRFGSRVRNRNMWLPIFFGAYTFYRFIIEFIRDMNYSWWSALTFAGLSFFQFALLTASLICLIIVYIMSRRTQSVLHHVPIIQPPTVGIATIMFMALAVLLLIPEKVQIIHSFQLLILLPMLLLLMFVDAMKAIAPRRALAYGMSLIALAMLVPFVTNLNSQFRSSVRKQSAFNRPTGIYTIDRRTNRMVRVGDRSMNYGQFARANRAISPSITDIRMTELYQAIQSSPDSVVVRKYGALDMGRYEMETCASVTEYVYTGAVLGKETEKYTGEMSTYTGGRLGVRVLKSGSSSDLLLSSVFYTGIEKPRWGWGWGIGLGYLEEPILMPSFHLRLGPPIFNLSIGFQDRTVIHSSPIPSHLTFNGITPMGSEYNVGISNFDYIPALYFSVLPARFNIRPAFFYIPPMGAASAGFGMSLQMVRK